MLKWNRGRVRPLEFHCHSTPAPCHERGGGDAPFNHKDVLVEFRVYSIQNDFPIWDTLGWARKVSIKVMVYQVFLNSSLRVRSELGFEALRQWRRAPLSRDRSRHARPSWRAELQTPGHLPGMGGLLA